MGKISAIAGNKLQLLRELAGWTQEQMAANVGGIVGKEQIGRYERLGIRPKEEVIEAYAQALNLEPIYLNQFISGIDLIADELPITLGGLQVGSRIWKLRNGRNVFALAEIAELFPEHWLRYEFGQGPPPLDVCDRIAVALGCNRYDLLQKVQPGIPLAKAFQTKDLKDINLETKPEEKLHESIDGYYKARIDELMKDLRDFMSKTTKLEEQLGELWKVNDDLRMELDQLKKGVLATRKKMDAN